MTPTFLVAAAAILAAGTAQPAAASSSPDRPTFDRAAWRDDLSRLKVALAQGYANLDWQVEKRQLNLKGADAAIGRMLDGVDSDVGATLVLVKLLEAFDDPHLELRPGPPPDGATLLPQSSDVAGPVDTAELCKAANFSPVRPGTRLPYPAAPGWREIAAGPFLAGTIGTIGIVRIPDFSETRYPDACARVVRPGLEGRELQLAVRAELNRQLAATVASLRAAGATRLVVDLSRNGGGSEWSSEAATIFTKGQLRRNEPRRAGPSCDRSAIWNGEKPACSIYAGQPSIETIEGEGAPAWDGPLGVIVDSHTASAAEEFATWLRDNDRARIGGTRTYGAGCGYMDGGNAFAFHAAPIHLMIPNCSRIRRDGTNEIEGITPDVAIDWMKLGPDGVAAALGRLF